MSTRPSTSSDSELRRFLLDTATDAEAEAFSLRILEDASDPDGTTLAEALADEDELIDEYVRGELDDDAAGRFEQHVLGRPDGRRRVDFARALARRAERHAKKRTTLAAPLLAAVGIDPENVDLENDESGDAEDGSLWRRLFASLHSPAARPAWALCALLFVAVLTLTIRVAQQDPAPVQATPEQATPVQATGAPDARQPASDPPAARAPSDVARDLERLESEAMDLRRRLDESHRQAEALRSDLEKFRAAASASSPAAEAAKVVELLLAATTRSSEIPAFDAPRDVDPVELQVDLSDAPDLHRVRARLLDASGFQIWGRPEAVVEGDAGMQALRLPVPAGLLSPGDYTLLVQSAGPDGETWRDVALREFRIRGG